MADLPATPAMRARDGELLSAASALLLAAVMFSLEWYGVAGVPGRSRFTSSENAWHALPLLRWLMLVTIAVAVGVLPLRASQRGHGAKTNTGWAVMLLGGATAALLVYRVLIALPAADRVVDQKLGAILGILGAVAVAFGGWQTMREERERTGGLVDEARRQKARPRLARFRCAAPKSSSEEADLAVGLPSQASLALAGGQSCASNTVPHIRDLERGVP